MKATVINGCKTESYSRMNKRCRQCDYKVYCKNKRLQAEAYITVPVQTPQIGISMKEATDAFNSLLRAKRRL